MILVSFLQLFCKFCAQSQRLPLIMCYFFKFAPIQEKLEKKEKHGQLMTEIKFCHNFNSYSQRLELVSDFMVNFPSSYTTITTTTWIKTGIKWNKYYVNVLLFILLFTVLSSLSVRRDGNVGEFIIYNARNSSSFEMSSHCLHTEHCTDSYAEALPVVCTLCTLHTMYVMSLFAIRLYDGYFSIVLNSFESTMLTINSHSYPYPLVWQDFLF